MSKRFYPNMPKPVSTKLRTEVSSERTPYGRVKATVRDKYGNIIDQRDQNVDSFVTNFWKMVYGWHSSALNQSLATLAGTNRIVENRQTMGDGALEQYQGIICGTSNTAVSYFQTTLPGRITHGVTFAGQISAHETSIYYNADTDEYEIVRTFSNADTNAADITVQEVGIAVTNVSGGATAGNEAVLVCRDVLDSALVIPFEGQLTVVYTFRFFNGNANYDRFIGGIIGRDRSNRITYSNIINVGGTSVSGTYSGRVWGFIADAVGDTSNGIVLGTGNASPTTKQTFSLESQIPHGESAGQLFYYESTISSLEEDGDTNSCRWYLNRVVQNRSGGTITVNEVGLHTLAPLPSESNRHIVMVDRVFPTEGGVPITNGAFATFSWEFCYEL